MDTVDISSKAAEYAGGKAVDCLNKAIEQAYKDGYLDGFKHGKELASDCVSTGEVNYIDLGLPSGTLWSDDYVMRDGELRMNCEWRCAHEGHSPVAKCIGPNGNMIRFRGDGKLEGDALIGRDVFFWLHSAVGEKENRQKGGNIWFYDNETMSSHGCKSIFAGIGLPIRLVKSRG